MQRHLGAEKDSYDTQCQGPATIYINNLEHTSFPNRTVKKNSVATQLFRGIILNIRKSLRWGASDSMKLSKWDYVVMAQIQKQLKPHPLVHCYLFALQQQQFLSCHRCDRCWTTLGLILGMELICKKHIYYSIYQYLQRSKCTANQC